MKLTDQEKKLLEFFRQLPGDDKEAIINITKAWAALHKEFLRKVRNG
jgi:hypothetical protein